MIDISNYEAFQRNKEVLTTAFEKAIYDTLVKMGDDIHGIDWFSSRAEFHPKNQVKMRRAA